MKSNTSCRLFPSAGVQEEADRGAAAGGAAAAPAAAGARLPGVAAAAAGAAAAAAGQEAAVPLQGPGAEQQRQTRLGQRGNLQGPGAQGPGPFTMRPGQETGASGETVFPCR